MCARFLCLISGLLTLASAANPPTDTEILSRIRREHPRLLAREHDFDALRERAVQSAEVAKWSAAIRREADQLLEAAPSEYSIPDGKRLLATSRRVLERTLYLALSFRLGGDTRHRDRLWRELEAVAAFKDWNPKHFLDTAEMTAAFAIGYDWLYADWTPAQRELLEKAIIDKGLTPALPTYRRNRSWATRRNNWNQVCNGGMTLGALAIADEDPALAGEILAAAINSIPRAMRQFAPDGACVEGPGYWDYATRYNVYMLAALDSALGTDFGLSGIEGFDKTADYPIHMTGPTQRSFNYADASDGRPGGSQMLWFASRFNRPSFAAWRMAGMSTPVPLDLLWGARWLDRPSAPDAAPTAKYFRGAEVVTMRGAWGDPETTFVGFKGGDNTVSHAHLDLGSFVLDAAGRRWALDLGADDYNLPGYFGSGRWNYYQCRAEGQNTLVLNPGAAPDQHLKAKAPITRFMSQPDTAFAIADLTTAYAHAATSVRRGIALAGRTVTVQDEVTAVKPCELWWFMHTTAKIQCDGATATLTLDGRKLVAQITSPPGAIFREMPAEPLRVSPKPERQQVTSDETHGTSGGVRKLAVHLENVTTATLCVVLSPDAASAPRPKALNEW